MFGMSVFQSVLTRLEEEQAAENPASEPPSLSIGGLPSGFVTQTAAHDFPHPDAVARIYSSYFDNQVPAKPIVMPPHLARTAPQEIAADLGTIETHTLAELNELRRNFARDNHPDGVHANFRPQATMRMKIANMLIDEAARRLGG